jgi:medium-chain acyl-[acyl-carrier-protein] hydrolase
MTENFNSQIKSMAAPWSLDQGGPTRAKLRLFCFPYSGGSANIFHGWEKFLPVTVRVCPVELPGRGRCIADPPFRQIAPLLQWLFNALHPYLNEPIAMFGHSLGALISFEFARLLVKADIRPIHLFVSGRRAPPASINRKPIFNLAEAEFIQELRRLKGTPQEVLTNYDFMKFIIPILKADFEICETYSYFDGPRLDCPITVFAGLQDDETTSEHLSLWRDQTTGPCTVHVLPGDHFFLRSAQPLLLRMLAKELHQIVDRVK